MKTPYSYGRIAGLLVICLFTWSAQAQFTFTTNNGAITITGYTGSGGNVVIPSATNGYPVTGIGTSAFSGNSLLTSVTIPNSIINIGTNAFVNCSSLTNVTIGSSVTSIGNSAFKSCSGLTSVTVPSSVTNIGVSAFARSGLAQAFFQGNAPTVNGSAGSADGTVFFGESGTVYYVPGATGWGATFGGWPTLASMSPTNFIYITNSGTIDIIGYIGTNSVVVVPDMINGLPTTSITKSAFASNSILTSVTIGNNVTNIDNAAFVDCSNLVSITVSSNNLSYSSVAGILFNKNQSLLLSYPGGLSGSYSISSNVATIGDYAFQYCFSLTNVTIPNSVTNVGIYAFANGGLFQANFQGNAPTVDGTIGSFDSSVFGGESGAVYYVPGTTGWGVTFGGWPTIPTEFSFTTNNGTITITGYTDTNSTAIIPDTINGLPVTTIGDSAFSSSTLTNVTIGNNVTNFVDNTAFVNCPNLLSIAVSSGNVSFCSVAGILFNINQTVIISYPCGLSGNYSIPNGVTSIEDYAFYNCIKLTNLTMPDSVISIGIAAFASCSGLANVTISTNVSSIGHDAFSSCSSLTSVTIPNSITTISDDAFAWCSDLTNVMIPNSVTTISDDAFIYCMNLTSVTIPNSVTSIGFVAFYWSGLTSVAIPDSVTNVGFGAFAWCFSLTNAIVGNNVPSMDGLFTRDSSLMNVTVGNSVTYIGHGAFSLAILTGLTLPSTVTNIDSMAFSGCSLQQLFFEGNAPTADGVPDGSAEGSYSIFTDDGIGTVYYLPGTSGWGSTFGGWPTALWLPQTQLASNSSAFTNGFGFNINWASGQTVVVEASTNLLNWTPVSTNTLVNGTSAFVDPSWTNSPQQFYRVRPQ